MRGVRAVFFLAAFDYLVVSVYDFYEHAPRLWGLSPLSDQQLAGMTMAAEQAIVLFAAFAIYVRRFLHEESSADTFRAPTVRPRLRR